MLVLYMYYDAVQIRATMQGGGGAGVSYRDIHSASRCLSQIYLLSDP